MVRENPNEMLRVGGEDFMKPWMKLTGPAAGTLGESFFGSTIVVRPEILATGSEGEEVLQHSVKVGVYNPPGPGAEDHMTGGGDKSGGTASSAKIIITRTDGAQRYIKVLRAYRMVLLGESGSGKSSLGNQILGETVFNLSGGIRSQVHSKSVHERRLTVVDTPGFSDQPEDELQRETVRCTTGCAPGPHAFLIVVKLEKSTEHLEVFIRKMSQCFPEEAYRYAVVVFTHGDQFDEGVDMDQFINQNQSVSDFVKKCGERYHVVNSNLQDDDNKSQMSELLNTIDKMVTENKGGCFTNRMLQRQKTERDENDGEDSCDVSKNMWIQFSGPAGNSVAEALFGLNVEDQQEPQGASEGATAEKEEENVTLTTRGQIVLGTSPRLRTMQGSDQTDQQTKETQVDDSSPKEKTPGGLFNKTSDGVSALGLLATLVTKGSTTLSRAILWISRAVKPGKRGDARATDATTEARGAEGAGGGERVKENMDQLTELYHVMRQNLGVVLLVVAFYVLLTFSFWSNMVGTFFLSGGVLVVFLVILVLLAAIRQQ